VRFVKAVTGEFFYQVEDFHRQLWVDPVGGSAVLEGIALLCHLLGIAFIFAASLSYRVQSLNFSGQCVYHVLAFSR
jgi:hypothetical protein